MSKLNWVWEYVVGYSLPDRVVCIKLSTTLKFIMLLENAVLHKK